MCACDLLCVYRLVAWVLVLRNRLSFVHAYFYFAIGIDDLESPSTDHDPEALNANGTDKCERDFGHGSWGYD